MEDPVLEDGADSGNKVDRCSIIPSCELVTLDNTREGVVLEPGWGKPTKNAAIILTQAPPPPDHIWGQSCYSISAEYKVSVVCRSGGVMSSVTTH